MKNKYEIKYFDNDLGCGCCYEEYYALYMNGKDVYQSDDYEDCLLGIINRENIDFTDR